MKQFKNIAFFLVFFATSIFAEYSEGIDYLELKKPVPTVSNDIIEVRELFWYYCPHCFNIEPKVQSWLKTKPSDVQFIRQPAVFSERWVNGAIFFYILEELGEVERLHEKLFDAIHVHKTILEDNDDFVDWLLSNGVDKKKAESIFKSFTLKIKLNKSQINTVKYDITGVPAFIVNGKYIVDTTTAGGSDRVFKIIDFLISQERN